LISADDCVTEEYNYAPDMMTAGYSDEVDIAAIDECAD